MVWEPQAYGNQWIPIGIQCFGNHSLRKTMNSYRNSRISYRNSMVWDPQAYGNQWIPIGIQWSGNQEPVEIIEFL